MIIMSFRIFVVLPGLLVVCRAYAPAPNPPMLTHASMDVGNIISIVIPESPDENVNVEQLTGEFRQQLERIKKQSRASKVEHGLVTLKRVLPEMSREEKRKTLPLIRRVLHGRRVANAGSFRNRTREAAHQAREGGQFARSRSAGNLDERIYRDYAEPGKAVTTRIDQSPADKDDFRRLNADRTYDSRREETPREDPGRWSDQTGQEELIRREDSDRRNDRVVIRNEDLSSSKIARSGPPQEWRNPDWEDQPQGDARNAYPETSTVDCSYKFDRAVRQKEPGNEILQDGYEKVQRLAELRVNVPEERNVDYAKLDQPMTSRYPFAGRDSVDNAKRTLKDARAFEPGDTPGLGNYPRELDVNGAVNPDCDVVRKNSSGHSLKEHEGMWDVPFDKQRQEASSFERENRRVSQRIIQDAREQSDRSNATGFENTVGESGDNYASKTKRGHGNSEDYRGLRSMKSNPVNRMERWNMPTYDERHPSNASDDIKGPPNVFEMFGEKDIHSGLDYIQGQGDLRVNLDSEPKMAASLQFANYGNGRRIRIRRTANGTDFRNATIEVPSNVTQGRREEHVHRTSGSLFERLKNLFKPPSMKNVVYTSVLLLYANKSDGHDERTSKASTETGKSQDTDSSSIAEPTSSTSHEVSLVLSTTTDSPTIWTTEDLAIKPHDTTGSF